MIYLLENPEREQERTLARRLLARGLEREYGIKGEPLIETAPLGKPYLADYPWIHFNYSHCTKGILCGISEEEIGVDIEGIIPYKERFAARICHRRELSMVLEAEDRDAMLTAVWTGKESYMKYLGLGLRRDLREIDLSEALMRQVPLDGVYLHSRLNGEYGLCVCCREPSVIIHKVKKDS